LDRSKSDFIAVAAHELKTPLTLIEGYASMMREQFSGDESAAMLSLLLKGVDNGTRRLGEIIDDMIDVSMIDNNLLSLNFQPTWINQLLELLEEELKESIDDRKQIIEIRDFQGSDQMTFADSERIYQALRNILTNAIKYTPDGGKIIVDGRLLSGFIEVTVEDSGIGIPVEDQSRIFEKFGSLGDVALHSSGKTKFKGGGPGLGLPITKGILEAHGGTIWVESDGYDEELLPGSVFHVLLPILDSPPDDKVSKLLKPMGELGKLNGLE
jgi:signal transduction histidine kinase